MMYKLVLLLCLSLGLAIPAQAGEWDTVLVVSIDALHPDALDKSAAPALHALMLGGRYTMHGRSVDPPKTLVAHTAMFTGLSPARSGKRDNDWQPGQPRVGQPTLFDDARRLGYRTAFIYAKPKLGYLVNEAVDEQALAPYDGIDRVANFLRQDGPRYAVLHLSGLEYAGSESGWLSPAYREALSYIDLELAPLLAQVIRRGRYLIVITSDHAGHGRQHGTRHPEDYKLPLIVAGTGKLGFRQNGSFRITQLRGLLQAALAQGSRDSGKGK